MTRGIPTTVLHDFVGARLDDLEQFAHTMTDVGAAIGAQTFGPTTGPALVELSSRVLADPRVGELMSRFAVLKMPTDVTWILEDARSKKAILAVHRPEMQYGVWCTGCKRVTWCPTLRYLAAPFRAHPGFQQVWLPTGWQVTTS